MSRLHRHLGREDGLRLDSGRGCGPGQGERGLVGQGLSVQCVHCYFLIEDTCREPRTRYRQAMHGYTIVNLLELKLENITFVFPSFFTHPVAADLALLEVTTRYLTSARPKF